MYIYWRSYASIVSSAQCYNVWQINSIVSKLAYIIEQMDELQQ